MAAKNQPKEVQQARRARWEACQASSQACDEYFSNPTPANKGRWEAAMEKAREASDHEKAMFSRYGS